ncbi:MAG: ribosomal protein [Verrucomicrobiota bacterium]|jgi:small subunit ribosomal protein S4
MARYTGPKTKLSRRFGVFLVGSPKHFERRSYPPGMHGQKGMRRKTSEYGLALLEKQKLKAQYGVLERQFRRYFETALSRRGITGETLLQLLETRLDNVVYRLGFARTRTAARQMVAHGHVKVNGRKNDIASANLKPGDSVTIKDSPKPRALAARQMEATQIRTVPDWLVVDRDNFSGTVSRIPTRDEIAPVVNEQLVVELYSR